MAAVGVILIGTWSGSGGTPASGASPASPYTVTLPLTSNLTDGTTVPVEVTSTNPTADPVGWVDIRVCRPGVAYTSYAVVETRGNCGFSPGSSAYRSPTGSATQDFPGEPSGARSFPDDFIAGVGTADYAGFSLTCDSTHPCDLVISVFTSETQAQGTTAQDVQSFPMTFLPFGKVDGCTGTAPDAIQTVSSDRLTEAYTNWSKQSCIPGGPGGGKAITTDTFIDEGGPFGAVGSFANGNADLAYAAGGYGLPGFSASTGRPYVAVPVALNAVVVAASGGQQVAGYTPKGSPPVTTSAPFSHLELTTAQAASLFGGGHVSAAQTQALDAENPELVAGAQIVPYTPPGGAATFIYPQAIAGDNATTVFVSTYFTDEAAKSWNSGPNAAAGQKPDVRRGVIPSFAQPGKGEPAFSSLGLYSHRTDLEKAALPYAGLGPLPLWVLTDRATATELGFTVAALGPGPSSLVAPTKATMDAAIPHMQAEPDGTLQPDPRQAGAAAKGAYPLTFVEYVLAPTEPLVDAACHPRTASEQLLIKWLKFLTGAGQTNLAAGLESLTPALQKKAAASIRKVGQAALTGACGPKTTAPAPAPVLPTPTSTPTTIVVPTSPAVPPTTSHVAVKPGRSKTRSSVAAPTTATTTAVPSTAPRQLAATQIPRLATRTKSGWVLPSIGLLLLGLLTGGMALRTSGRLRLASIFSAAGLRRRGGRKGRP